MANPAGAERLNIPHLTGFRGIAALLVFLSHMANEGLLPKQFSGLGQIGVLLFFLLSGFLMAYLYVHEPFNRESLVRYAASRAGRVVPLYWLVAVLAIIMTPMAVGWPYRISGAEIPRALGFIQASDVLWTIPVEIQFYVTFVGIWWIWSRTHRLGLVAALMVIGSIPCAAMVLTGNGTSYLPLFAPYFLAGSAIGLVWRDKLQPWLNRRRTLTTVGGLFAFVGLCVNLPALRLEHNLAVGQNIYWVTWHDPITVSIAIVLLMAAAAQAPSLSFLANRALVRLGELSYSVYLLHRLVILGAVGLLGATLVAAVVAVVGTVIAAELSRVLVERPARRWVKIRTERRIRDSRYAARSGP